MTNEVFFNYQEKFVLNFELNDFVNRVLDHLDIQDAYIEFNFVSKKYLLDINKKYLNKHYDTDVITFNLAKSNESIHGDVYISVRQALKNSKRYNDTFSNEIKLLCVHSVLHLIGYEDYTMKDRETMSNLQKDIIKQLDK